MIYLTDDCLEISFPELQNYAGIRINFQRTLRIPDDGQLHSLPPGLGKFPLRHIEDFDLTKHNHLKLDFNLTRYEASAHITFKLNKQKIEDVITEHGTD